MRILEFTLALASFASASHASMAANLIRDGGFERPLAPNKFYRDFDAGERLGPWLVVGPGDVALTSTNYQSRGVTFNAHKGLAFLDLTGLCDCGDASGVSQTVTTTPNTAYELSFWVGNTVIADVGKTSTVNVYNGSDLLISAKNRRGAGTNTQNWKKFKVTFVATSTSATLTFLSGDPNHDINCGLDSVKLEAE